MAVADKVRSLADNRRYGHIIPHDPNLWQERIIPKADRADVDRRVKSGAVTQLFENNPFFSSFDYVRQEEGSFKEYESLADPKTQKKTIKEIVKIAAKSNPHMKAAMTDFQDYTAGGWGFKPQKSIVVDILLDTMENEFEGFDAYLSDATDSLFLFSAFFHESVYDDQFRLRRVIVNEHDSAVFRQDKTHPLGDRYLLGQYELNSFNFRRWKNLQDDPTTFYRKLYSKANYPYGVPFVNAAVFHMVMMVEFFKSYKSLLDSFVLPNLFFRVDREVVEKVVTDPTKREGFVRQVFGMLMSQVKKLGPGRVVTMGSEVMEPEILSGMNEKTMGASESLINALDNQLELALKTHGLTTLRNDSALNDTKAKYRMANYARVIKRAQGVITKPVNRQIKQAHLEVGSSEISDLYLERNIYEDEQILAEISSTITKARVDGWNAVSVIMETLSIAVEKGFITQTQANQRFIDEMDKIDEQLKLADPLESDY